ncbi:fimbrial protein [Salmonella enterica]|nr:fimbrial protein [Salmonella enterica]
MKTNHLRLSIAALLALTISPAALAAGDSLDAKLTATIVATTCDMKLVGGAGTDTKQTLYFKVGTNPWVHIDDVQAGKATATFKLAIVECPASLTSLKTTVSGTKSADTPLGLANLIAAADGGAEYAAVSIARTSAPTAPFTINSTIDNERLIWTADEIKKKEVPLIASIYETRSGMVTLGQFKTVATFEFSYE